MGVLFATPGMLHAGLSLQVFKEWVSSEKNTLIIPGYCVAGTLGNKLLSGVKSVYLDKKSYEIKMAIRNMSFSAHADARGILNLIRHVEPKNVMLVHGEKKKMDVLSAIIEEQFDVKCYYPANFETVTIKCNPSELKLEVVGSGRLGATGMLVLDEGKSSLWFFERQLMEEDLQHTIKLMQDDEKVLEMKSLRIDFGFMLHLTDDLRRLMSNTAKELQERVLKTEINMKVFDFLKKNHDVDDKQVNQLRNSYELDVVDNELVLIRHSKEKKEYARVIAEIITHILKDGK
eukprot:TRINITY_DN12389_c0_g1_i1.p1 TRINITY_DN12389_c0_g1~~TRINITY_DN12389_c0_g1_i1.p1  ORF type:complete len:289 (+),score=61.30 TRINITY_DN12389_c0_g1_i1:3-869(+)